MIPCPSSDSAIARESAEAARTDRLARGHQFVQQLLADEATPAISRILWKEMYFAMGDAATLEDLREIARRLQAAQQRAARTPFEAQATAEDAA